MVKGKEERERWGELERERETQWYVGVVRTRSRQEVDVLVCLVAGVDGCGWAGVCVHVLRCLVPPPEQAGAAHPLAQPRVAQVPWAGGPPAAAGSAGPRAGHAPAPGGPLPHSRYDRADGPRARGPLGPDLRRRPLQVLRQVLPRRRLPDSPPAGPHRRQAVQVRVLWQGVQAPPPHEGSLPGTHRRATVSVHAVRKDLLEVDDTEGTRENALSEVCAQVPVPEPRGPLRGRGPAAATAASLSSP